jgi:hypothetical protein
LVRRRTNPARNFRNLPAAQQAALHPRDEPGRIAEWPGRSYLPGKDAEGATRLEGYSM